MSTEETLPAESIAPRGQAAAPAASEAIAQGGRVDRYTLLERVGSGTTGVVFAAYDPRLDRKVALKVLHGAGVAALSEARALAKLSHGNVVAVHDVGTAGGHSYVAMAFVDGPTLATWRPVETGAKSRVVALVGVLVGAGRGLAEAHAAGLVHRDFKPANVLVKDGRIAKVVDFGLATAEAGPDAPVGADRQRLVGTPAYMAPEVFAGHEADARADQFSFCVSAYEALYDHRPFAGKSTFAIMEAVTEHRLVPESDPRGVPAALRAALLRGLELEADERWPSMDALLETMQRSVDDGGRRTTKWAVGVGLGIAAVVTAAGMLGDRGPGCEAAAEDIDAVWNPARRDAVGAAFAALNEPYAETTLQTVVADLDTYAGQWRDTHVAACQGRSQGVASDVLFDRRVACLGRGRAALSTLVDLLTTADRDLLLRSVAASRSLPELSSCRHVESLLARQAPPDDPEAAGEVERIRSELVRAETERAAGRRDTADARIAEALAAARRVHYDPALVDALLASARNTRRTDPEASDNALREAWGLALSTGDDVAAADVAVLRVQRYAAPPAAGARADDAVHTATALVQRLASRNDETASSRAAMVENGRGFIAFRRGQTQAAIAIFRALRDEAVDRWGEDDRRTRMHAHALAMAVQASGDFAEAAEIFADEADAAALEMGEAHPQVALIRTNLGLMLRHLGKLGPAAKQLRDALAVLDGVAGYERDAARAHDNLAETLFADGDLETAAKHYALGATAQSSRDPPGIGEVPRLLHYGAALAATADANASRDDQAVAILRRALAGAEVADHRVYQSDALLRLSRVSVRQQDFPNAVALARQGLDLQPAADGDSLSPSLGLALAEALWLRDGDGDREEAVRGVQRVQTSLAQGTPSAAPLRAALEVWLVRRQGPPPTR